MPLPDPIREVLAVFRPLFTAPTWRKLMTLLTGTLLARGRRTVAAALRASGNAQAGDWSLFHQVLNRARWSPLALSRQLLLLIVETFVPAGACIDLVIDETLERRWGNKISKRGHYRDSALSSKKRSVSSPGLRWIVMAVVVTLPQAPGRDGPCPFCVCWQPPAARQWTAGQAAQNSRDVGASVDQPGASLAPRSRDQADGGYGLHRGGTGRACSEKTGDLGHDGSSGCSAPCASARTHGAYHRSSSCRRTSARFTATGGARSADELASAHPGLVRGGEAHGGDLHGHGAVVPFGVCSLADPLGPHA
jgi:hypothetical protein